MDIYCLASSSHANCYILKNGTTTLMVEAGLPFQETKMQLSKLNINLNKIDAIVITHEHGDHCKETTIRSLNVYAPVISNVNVTRKAFMKHAIALSEWKPFIIKTMKITPFKVDHDVLSFGYIIQDLEANESLLFINDTAYVGYNFSQLIFDYIMIECNHIADKIDTKDSIFRRKISSHMSLKSTILALKSMNLSATKKIYLMHLSDSNSDEGLMIKEVQKATGISTYVCGKHGGFV